VAWLCWISIFVYIIFIYYLYYVQYHRYYNLLTYFSMSRIPVGFHWQSRLSHWICQCTSTPLPCLPSCKAVLSFNAKWVQGLL
jgi:hypothetical protein